jgi:hypothetical protein
MRNLGEGAWMMNNPITEEQVQAAEQRWAEEVGCWPAAVQARFDPGMRRVVVSLSTGLDLLLNPDTIRGFEKIAAELLMQVEIEASGYALHFPLVDEGIWLPSIYEESFSRLRPVETAADKSIQALAA